MAGISVLFKPALCGEQLLQLLQVTGIVLKATAVIESLSGLCCCRVFKFLTQAQAQNILLRSVIQCTLKHLQWIFPVPVVLFSPFYCDQ